MKNFLPSKLNTRIALLLGISSVLLNFTAFSQYLHFAKILPRVGSSTAGYYSAAMSIGIDGNKNIYSQGVFSHVIDFDPGPGKQQITPYSALSIYITKMDSLGNFIWVKTLDGQCHDGLADILVNQGGSFFLAGSSWSFGAGVDLDPGAGTHMSSKSGFITKFDQNGNFVWTKELDCGPKKIKSDLAGNLYITGSFGGTVDFDPGAGTYNVTSQTSSRDLFILKLDSAGDFIWVKQFSSSLLTSHNLSVDGNANLCLSGSFEGQFDADPGPNTSYLYPQTTKDFYIVKLDSSGSFVWAGSVATTYVVTAMDFYGNIYLNGNFTNTLDIDPGIGVNNVTANVGSTDIFYTKLDPLGNLIWSKTIQSSGTKSAGTFIVDHLGNIFSSGMFTSVVDFDPDPVGYSSLNAGLGMSFLHRMDSSGNLKWVKQYGTSNAPVYGHMAIDSASNVYITGTIYGENTPLGTINWDPGFSNYTTNDPDYSFFITKYSAVFTPVLDVKENSTLSALSIYPNPTERFLWFQKDKSVSNSDLHLYNGTGVDLISNTFITQQDDKITLDLSGVPCGAYILIAGKQRAVILKK